MPSYHKKLMAKQFTIITPNKAMNDNHHAHVKSVVESGYAQVLDLDQEQLIADGTPTTTKVKPAATVIAEGIMKHITKSQNPSKEPSCSSSEQLARLGRTNQIGKIL